MRLCTLVLTLGAALCMANASQAAFDLIWDGGDGMWFSVDPLGATGNWNGGQNIINVVGRENGQEGYRDTTGPTDVFIGGGSKVSFDGFTISEDFRIMQGSTMTVTEGAVWEHKTLDADEAVESIAGFGPLFRWEETRWTIMEPSELNLDNGTFRRTGGTTFDPTDAGGGALFFGSWKGDDNFGDRDDDADTDGQDFLAWQVAAASAGDLRKVRGTYGDSPNADDIDINISNGGALENEGQMIFGADGDWQLNIDITINDGSIAATGGIDASPGPIGGDIPGGDASIVIGLAHGFEGAFDTHVAINFTGPGTITTDEGAIRVIDLPMDAAGDVTGFTVTDASYEDLWDLGILQANGGNAGAFGDHFSVAGAWGDAVYTLTSNVVAAASAGVSSVPEPTSIMLAGLAIVSFAGVRRRRA